MNVSLITPYFGSDALPILQTPFTHRRKTAAVGLAERARLPPEGNSRQISSSNTVSIQATGRNGKYKYLIAPYEYRMPETGK
jgi:hypothetical protein